MKQVVKPWTNPPKGKKKAAHNGQNALTPGYAAVIYKRKHWDLAELVQTLAIENRQLRKRQCQPSVKCLFEGQRYLDEKYGVKNDPTKISN